MKAVFYREHGGEIEYGELPAPVPAPTEALVQLEAVSLNRVELFTWEGWPGLELEMPHVPGADGAGRVVEIGSQVTRFAVGDRVVINPSLFCGECDFCLAGQENLCKQWQLLGEHTPGTFRELIALPERNLLKMPKDFDAAVAAASALVYLTAWHSLITRGRLRAGESVLVVGASGGVNTASIQIAKYSGASVLVVGSGADKLAIAKDAGADLLIDRSQDATWSKTAYLAQGRRGVEVVVDNVGADTMPLSLRAARKGGRILTVGNTSGPKYELDNRLLFGKHLSIIGSTMGTAADFETVMGLVFEGKLNPILDRQFPLEEAGEAFARMQAGEQRGKITLMVP
ncbi:MAG: zinc-binding dehydrogenase [Anaerolineae bacterium]|nr:MAG: zinc-binding dehydrogenase [Anaerolineae bacterium]